MQPNPALPLGPVTVDDRLAPPAPVALGTLRPGTLPSATHDRGRAPDAGPAAGWDGATSRTKS